MKNVGVLRCQHAEILWRLLAEMLLRFDINIIMKVPKYQGAKMSKCYGMNMKNSNGAIMPNCEDVKITTNEC